MSDLPYEPLGGEPQNPEQGSNVDSIPEPVQDKVQKKPRKRVGLSKTAFFMIFALLVLIIGGYVVYTVFNVNQPQTPPQDQPVEEPIVPPVEEDSTTQQSSEDGWIEYFNKTEEILIKYPQTAKFREPQEMGIFNVYEVTYATERQTQELNTDENLQDGYIVRFLVQNNVTNTDLNQIALDKRNSYIIRCPDTATISNITQSTISNLNALTITVENCNGNFIDSFTLRDNDLVEVLQVYQGDLGFRQVHRNSTIEIVNRFEFTNIIQATPKETWTTHTEPSYGIRFRYPSEFNSTCCSLNGPVSTTVQKRIILADNESVEKGQGQKFTGFGVFIEPNRDQTGFYQYVEEQKQLLKENYRVVVGKEPPQLTQDEVTISGQPGIKLTGYAWWGDMYFVPLVNQRSIMVISKTELNPGEFDELFSDILGSFELYNPVNR